MKQVTIEDVNQFINDFESFINDKNKGFSGLGQALRIMALKTSLGGLKKVKDEAIKNNKVDEFIAKEQDMLRRTGWCVYYALENNEKADEYMTPEEVDKDREKVKEELKRRDGIIPDEDKEEVKEEVKEEKPYKAHLNSIDSLKDIKRDLVALSIIAPRVVIEEDAKNGTFKIIAAEDNEISRKQFEKIKYLFIDPHQNCDGDYDNCDHNFLNKKED